MSAVPSKEPPEIYPLGDSALILHIGKTDEPPGERLTDKVLAAAARIRRSNIAGVVDVTPAYATVAIFYDPLGVKTAYRETIFDALIRQLADALKHGSSARIAKSRLVEVPVCYAAEFAPDMDRVVGETGLARAEVVARHSRARYRVACVGFTAGFPYLLGLPPELAVPRRASPRTSVPEGSVAIGGVQTGIYPKASPGGWNIIGRSPLRLFDPEEDPPVALRPGDRVRFREISRDQFEAHLRS